MVDYSKSKLYTIISASNPDLYYIGSTTQDLKRRFSTHLHLYKQYKKGLSHWMPSFKVMKYEDAEILLLFEVNCFDRAHLSDIETNLIYKLKKMNKVKGRQTG